MSWNYRVMTLDGGQSYEIHEVYYDSAGKPHTYTMNPVKPFGENLRELRQDLMWMLKSLDEPVLTLQDFPGLEA
jgi:hypothetical protein